MCPTPRRLFGFWLLCASIGAPALADSDSVSAKLKGFQEVPSVSTAAEGRFKLRIDRDAGTMSYELSYGGLEASVLQSHIHFGQRSVNGGIAIFLCTNLGNSQVPVQSCPASPASISGVIRAGDVIGPGPQGVAAGELAEIIDAIDSGVAYVNVHSDKFPGGEIRAQLRRDD